jgi:hypothetical protein
LRFIGVFLVLVVSAFFTLIVIAAPESCVLAERDPDGGADAVAQPPPTSVADVLGGCTCCGNTILPLLPDCSGNVAFAVAAGDCPKDCDESTAYVLCQGVCYSDCACDLPEGFSLLDGGP